MRYFPYHEDARFAFNTGFLKIILGLSSVDIETLHFHGWAKRIMANVLIDEYRKNKNHDTLIFTKDTDRDLELVGENTLNLAEGNLSYESILELLKTIPPISAEAFQLFVIEGFSHKEIGEMLNITEGTSKWHVSTARKSLRELLEQQELITHQRFAI